MIMMMQKIKDDEDSGEIDKLSSVGSELIVSEILLATARKCTAENDHDDEVKYKSRSKDISTFFLEATHYFEIVKIVSLILFCRLCLHLFFVLF